MKRSSVLAALTVLMLTGTLFASFVAEDRVPHPLARSLDRMPSEIDGWHGSPGAVPDAAELKLLGATSFLSRDYHREGRGLGLFIAYYAVQKAGDSLHSPKNCLPGAGWEILNYDEANVPFGNRAERINKFTIQNGDTRALVLYWYQTRNRVIASEYAGKSFLVWDAMTKGRTDGSFVRIIVPDNPQAANDALGFARAIVREMNLSIGT
jgi:EpsI family protein